MTEREASSVGSRAEKQVGEGEDDAGAGDERRQTIAYDGRIFDRSLEALCELSVYHSW